MAAMATLPSNLTSYGLAKKAPDQKLALPPDAHPRGYPATTSAKLGGEGHFTRRAHFQSSLYASCESPPTSFHREHPGSSRELSQLA